MSTHWTAMTQQTIGVTLSNEIAALTAKLAQLNPEAAERIRSLLAQPAIAKQIVREAIAAAVERVPGAKRAESYDNSSRWSGDRGRSGKPKRGECIGVLSADGAQLGIAVDGTQIDWFWNGYAAEQRPADLKRLQTMFLRALQERTTHAVVRMLQGQEVATERRSDGTVVFRVAIVKGVA